jgi:hypothetical protein
VLRRHSREVARAHALRLRRLPLHTPHTARRALPRLRTATTKR